MPLQKQIWTTVSIMLLTLLLSEQTSNQRKNGKDLDKLQKNGSSSEFKTFPPNKTFVGSSQKISAKYKADKNGIKYEEKRHAKEKKRKRENKTDKKGKRANNKKKKKHKKHTT